MRVHLERLFGVAIHPEFDGERETFTVYTPREVIRADSLSALWAALLERQPVPAYDMRIAA